MVSGTVKIYSTSWKFGFIAKDDGGQVFFLDSGVTFGTIRKDDIVKFDVDVGPRGARAVNIQKM